MRSVALTDAPARQLVPENLPPSLADMDKNCRE